MPCHRDWRPCPPTGFCCHERFRRRQIRPHRTETHIGSYCLQNLSSILPVPKLGRLGKGNKGGESLQKDSGRLTFYCRDIGHRADSAREMGERTVWNMGHHSQPRH